MISIPTSFLDEEPGEKKVFQPVYAACSIMYIQ